MTALTQESSPLDLRSRLIELSGLVVPLAFFASAAALSAHHSRPENAVETAFLGLLAAVVLTAVACIERTPQALLGGIALAVASALWALPAGGARGAAVSIALTIGLGLVIRREARSFAQGLQGSSFAALAIAGHALFEPEIWLAPALTPAFAGRAILVPAIAGLAARELSQRRGSSLLPGIALMVALQRGFSPELALLLTIWCALSLTSERRAAALGWAAATLAILYVNASELVLLFEPLRQWPEVAGALAWLPLLVPAALRPRRGRSGALLMAVVLALVGSCLLSADTARLVPLFLLVDCIPRSGAAARLQAVWSMFLVAAAAGAASYPWLRSEPIETAFGLIGIAPDWKNALLVASLFWALVAAASRLEARNSPVRRAAGIEAIAALAISAGLILNVLPSSRSLLPQPVVLSALEPFRTLPVRGSTSTAIVDSYVSNGVAVAPGTPLAEVSLEGPHGSHRILVLRSGVDTGEWAARRPGLDVVVPPPWISWPAPDGPYFAQRYRTVVHLETAIEVEGLSLRRLPGLPDELELAVIQIGVGP